MNKGFLCSVAAIFAALSGVVGAQNVPAESVGKVNLRVSAPGAPPKDDFYPLTHRQMAYYFAQSLQSAADRSPADIGESIKSIVRAQSDAEASTTAAIAQLQDENNIKTFFLGADQVKLEELRTGVILTRSRLEQLERLQAEIRPESAAALINAPIREMEAEQGRLEAFIQKKEAQFSLFGWLAKLFFA
ncbi:MAG: hypothetical protein MUD10_04210 [Candidatus Pacebacteria bacterium]|jgi:hypothetical protein|nr:hypothetical protein [Candidatus Paceibacterota bacterium]